MKKLLPLIVLLLISHIASSQTKVALQASKEILSIANATALTQKLKERGYDYTTLVDLNFKCDYYFAQLIDQNGKLNLELKNCKDQVIGKADLGANTVVGNSEDFATLVSYKIHEFIKYPTQATESDKNDQGFFTGTPTKNEHNTRYLFSPTAFNLNKGELYVNTQYFAVWDFQYGLTDKISLGMGSTLGLFPFYITPKFSHVINEKNRIAIGDMFVVGTYGVDFKANLLYGVYTYGSQFNNITLGGGMITFNGFNDNNIRSTRPILNIGGMAQVSDFIYIVSENYLTFGSTSGADYVYDPNTGMGFNTPYTQTDNTALGALVFRFINKKKNVSSFQFGLAYFSNATNRTFNQNLAPPETKNRLFFVPTFSFMTKLGKKV